MKKNFLIFNANKFSFLLSLLFPLIILLLTILLRPSDLDNPNIEKLNLEKSFTFFLKNYSNSNSSEEEEIQLIKDNLKNSKVYVNLTGVDSLFKINFTDFVEKKNLCKSEINQCNLTFKDEKDIKEKILLDNLTFKVYTQKYVAEYPPHNQLSELYSIPDIFNATYLEALMAFYYKSFLTLVPNLDIPEIRATFYPMSVSNSVRLINEDGMTGNDPMRNIVLSFIFFSLSFIFIIISLGEMVFLEKKNKIDILLKFQGIRTLFNYLSWFISFLLFDSIFIILYFLSISLIWLDFKPLTSIWTLMALLLQTLYLETLIIFLTSIFSQSIFYKNILYLIYLIPIVMSFCNFFGKGNKFISAFLPLFPNIGLIYMLEMLFLSTNYDTGMNLSLMYKKHRTQTFGEVYLKGSIVVVLLFILTFVIEILKSKKFPKCCNFNDKKDERKIELDSKNFQREMSFQREKQEANKNYLIFQKVSKYFGNFCAVKSFSQKLYYDQIFVLLGENGAGKTTLLNLVLGQLELSEGEIELNGQSLIDNKDFLYKNLGVCPQESIYFPELTVNQQLELICELKLNTTKEESQKEKEILIDQLELKEYLNNEAKNLSEGTIRKLCIAFALIGKSKLVIFDEPTSGMDFKSKKRLWDNLKSLKKNRIIIVTTHSMEEAEFLADSVGIMKGGELICNGTPTFLKEKYSCGLNINIIFRKRETTIKEKVELLTEMRQIDSNCQVMAFTNNLLKIKFEDNVILNHKISYIFQKLENLFQKCKIEDYSVSTTTLGNVFEKIVNNNYTNDLLEQSVNYNICEKKNKNEIVLDLSNSFEMAQVNLIEEKQNKPSVKKSTNSMNKTPVVAKKNVSPIIINIKRQLVDSWHASLFLLIQLIPITFIVLILYVTNLQKEEIKNEIEFSYGKMISNSSKIFYQFEDHNQTQENNSIDNYFKIQEEGNIRIIKAEGEQIQNITDGNSFKEIQKNSDLSFADVFLIIYLTKDLVDYHIYYDLSKTDLCQIIFKNIISTKLSTKIKGNLSFYFNYDEIVKQSFFALFAVLFVLLHILAGLFFIYRPLEDKISGVKSLILFSLGNPLKYWFSLFIIDYLKYSIMITISYFILFIMNSYSNTQIIFWKIFFFSLLFGIPIILIAYVSSFVSDKEKHATLFYLIINAIPMVVIIFVRLFIQNFEELRSFDIWPPTLLMHFAFICQDKQKTIETKYIIIWIALFIVENVFLFLLNYCIEIKLFRRLWHKIIEKTKFSSNLQQAIITEGDLLNESNFLTFNNLIVEYKRYLHKDVRAINKMSLEIKPNENFGLMGYNGAGKSTLLKTLSNMIDDVSGNIYYNGSNLLDNFMYFKKNIGYCPQKDSIFQYLTVEETLSYYINIRENKNDDIIDNSNVEEVMAKFGLIDFRNSLAKNLSGGNKRKLLFAVALLSNPELVLLDEPSTGVDPESRKLMWKNILDLQNKRRTMKKTFNLIISTHSFEEAEIICDTIGWMKNGKFDYVGNSEKLKIKINRGYFLKIRFEKGENPYCILEGTLPNLRKINNADKLLIDEVIANKISNQKQFEYLSCLEEICSDLLSQGTIITFKENIDNVFVLDLEIPEGKKKYIFINILSISTAYNNVTEVSIGMEPFESHLITN